MTKATTIGFAVVLKLSFVVHCLLHLFHIVENAYRIADLEVCVCACVYNEYDSI